MARAARARRERQTSPNATGYFTKKTVVTCIIGYFGVLPFIAWTISSNSSSSIYSSLSPAVTQKLAPIIDQIHDAEDAHAAGRLEATQKSLRSAFTDFRSEFGEGPKEAIHVLSSFLLGKETDNLALAAQPNESIIKLKSNQLGQLWYDVAKEVFGPRHFYTITILQSLAVRLYNQGQLDKSLELHLVLVKILRRQINVLSQAESQSTSLSHDGENVDDLSDSRTLSLLLIRVLDNVRMLHMTNKQWEKALEVCKEMYGLYKSIIGLASRDTLGVLEHIVKLYQLIPANDLEQQQTLLFQQVTQVLDLPEEITNEDTQMIEKAYGVASEMVKSVPSLAFPFYLQFLAIEQGLKENRQGEFEAGQVSLKYEEEVYEILFVIVRLLRSSASLRNRGEEYEEYVQTLQLLKGDVEDEVSELTSNFVNIDPPVAKAQREEAIERVKDILKKVEVKFGKTGGRTKGVAEIIRSLYAEVGMTKEAEEIRQNFGLSTVNIKEEL